MVNVSVKATLGEVVGQVKLDLVFHGEAILG
jgi:hypothetical protein